MAISPITSQTRSTGTSITKGVAGIVTKTDLGTGTRISNREGASTTGTGKIIETTTITETKTEAAITTKTAVARIRTGTREGSAPTHRTRETTTTAETRITVSRMGKGTIKTTIGTEGTRTKIIRGFKAKEGGEGGLKTKGNAGLEASAEHLLRASRITGRISADSSTPKATSSSLKITSTAIIRVIPNLSFI